MVPSVDKVVVVIQFEAVVAEASWGWSCCISTTNGLDWAVLYSGPPEQEVRLCVQACRPWAPSDFGRSANPISSKGGRLCPPNNTGTPEFSDVPMALLCVCGGRGEGPKKRQNILHYNTFSYSFCITRFLNLPPALVCIWRSQSYSDSQIGCLPWWPS